MYTEIRYVCEVCGSSFPEREAAFACEAQCNGLTMPVIKGLSSPEKVTV